MADKFSERILSELQQNYDLLLNEGLTDEAEQTRETGKSVCKIEFDHYANIDRIEAAARESTVHEFEDIISSGQSSTRQFNENTSNRLKKFVENLNKIKARHNNNNGTMSSPSGAEAGNHVPTVDPITKSALVNPVMNRICGHIYGKQSVLESLQQNQRLRCPTMGCGNKEFIKAADLVDYE